jgi:hypothetical protein
MDSLEKLALEYYMKEIESEGEIDGLGIYQSPCYYYILVNETGEILGDAATLALARVVRQRVARWLKGGRYD